MLIVCSIWDAQKEAKNETRCYLGYRMCNFLLLWPFLDSYFVYNRNYVQILMYVLVRVWIITYRLSLLWNSYLLLRFPQMKSCADQLLYIIAHKGRHRTSLCFSISTANHSESLSCGSSLLLKAEVTQDAFWRDNVFGFG